MPDDERSSTITLGTKKLWLSQSQSQGDDAGHEEIDALLLDPEVIPASWQGHVLVFASARDEDTTGDPCVRSLYFDGSKWDERFFYLGDDDWLPSDRFVQASEAPSS